MCHMARAGREVNKGLLLLILADQWHASPRNTARDYVV